MKPLGLSFRNLFRRKNSGGNTDYGDERHSVTLSTDLDGRAKFHNESTSGYVSANASLASSIGSLSQDSQLQSTPESGFHETAAQSNKPLLLSKGPSIRRVGPAIPRNPSQRSSSRTRPVSLHLTPDRNIKHLSPNDDIGIGGTVREDSEGNLDLKSQGRSLRNSNVIGRPVPISRGKSEFALGDPTDGIATKSSSRINLAQSISDLKQTADHLKEVFIKLVTYDKVIKIAPPGNEGDGPWNDPFECTPIPKWQLNPDAIANKTSVHVMTIGRPQYDPESGEEQRRVQVYERYIDIPNMEEIAKDLIHNPAEGLLVVAPILRFPNSSCKLSDKILTKQAAISALTMAQISLLPLFGSWLNPLLCQEDVIASTNTVYLCGHCTENGTVARVLKPMEPDCDRDRVTTHLTTMLSSVLRTYWETHETTGWSMSVVVPPGIKGEQTFY